METQSTQQTFLPGSMTLEAWCLWQGFGAKKGLAQLVGVSPASISRILKGEERPSVALAERISVQTEGLVAIRTLLFPNGLAPGAVW